MGQSTKTESVNQLFEESQDLIKKITPKIKESVKSLCDAATYLDKVWKDCKIAHASGCTAGMVGAGLTIGGGVATLLTAGAAAPLLIAGIAIGIAAATTNVGTAVVEKAINWSKIKKAEKDMKQSHDLLKEGLSDIQDIILTRVKENVENQESSGSAAPDQKISKDIAKYIGVLSKDFVIPSVGIGADLHELIAQFVKVFVKSAGKESINATGKTAAKAGMAAAEGTGDAVESGAKAGLKASVRAAAKATIALRVVVFVVDAIDLGLTVRAIVKNKGSDAAKCLREEANKMEKIIHLDNKSLTNIIFHLIKTLNKYNCN